MFRLFRIEPVNEPLRIGQDWSNIQQGLRFNLLKTIEYYQTNVGAVANEHLLVTILNSIGVSTKLPLDRYYANVIDRSGDLSRVMNLTSGFNRGKVKEGVFYACKETILYLEDDFNYEEYYKDWLNIRALNVLRHPYSDISLLLPDAKVNGTLQGIAITSLDIAKLCIQYKAFRDREAYRYKTIPDYVELTDKQFIKMHVLPNALPSILDESIFNRLYCYSVGMPLGEVYGRHPFYLTDWSKRLDLYLLQKLKYFKHNKLDFTTLLQSVGLVDLPNLLDLCLLPDVAKTRQVMWLLVLARTRTLIWLLKLTKDSGSNSNNADINRLKKFFTRVKYNNEIITQLPLAFKEVLDDELDELYSLLGIS